YKLPASVPTITLPLHDALPISLDSLPGQQHAPFAPDRDLPAGIMPDVRDGDIRRRGEGITHRDRPIPANLPTRSAKNIGAWEILDRKSTRLNSSHLVISYVVLC